MPDSPRRRLTRRPPPRPTFEAAAPVAGGAMGVRQSHETQRVLAHTAREVPYLVAELKRVAGVTAVCFGLLAVLVIVDRLR